MWIHSYELLILRNIIQKSFRAKSHMYFVQSGNSSPDTVKSFVCSLDVHTQTSESAGTGHSTRRWAVDLDPWAETRHRPRPITSNASARRTAHCCRKSRTHSGSRQSKRRVEITAWNKTKRKHIVSFQVSVGLNIFQHVGETFLKVKLSIVFCLFQMLIRKSEF